MNRRQLFSGAASTALAVAGLVKMGRNSAYAAKLPGLYRYTGFSKEFALPEPLLLSQVEAMTPTQIADSSALVRAAYQELHQVASSLEKEEYRAVMSDILTHPRLTVMTDLYRTPADRKAIFNEMVKHGFFMAEDNPDYVFPPGVENIQTMYTSPQSHNDWYGSHPGGMALVVAFNIRIADAHTNSYRGVYGVPTSRDIPACALGVHEFPKSWFHSWKPDGSYNEEPRSLYGLAFHTHATFVVAEMMHRGMDSALTMAVAAAHSTGSIDVKAEGHHTAVTLTGPAAVADIIHSGAVLAQVDPVDYGLLKRKSDGKYELAVLPAEQWVTHLGDMNWPYTLGAAHPVSHELLKMMAQEDYGIPAKDLQAFPYARPFNQLKNYVWAQLGEITLYEVMQREGNDAARALVKRLVNHTA